MENEGKLTSNLFLCLYICMYVYNVPPCTYSREAMFPSIPIFETCTHFQVPYNLGLNVWVYPFVLFILLDVLSNPQLALLHDVLLSSTDLIVSFMDTNIISFFL
jgi:hypothetical protein